MTETDAKKAAKEALIMHKAGTSIVLNASEEAMEYMTNEVLNLSSEEARAKLLEEHALYMGIASTLGKLETSVFKDLKEALKNVEEDTGEMLFDVALGRLHMNIHEALKKYEEE